MSSNTLIVLRNLLKEVKKNNSSLTKDKSLLANYILLQSRKYLVTDEQACKAREEMKFVAETYLCYLKSQRLFDEIHKKYQGKGERSIKETAEIVGFKLPHDPK